MTIAHRAVLDDDIFDGHRNPAAVGIPARFQGDAIIAGVEIAVLDENVAARLRIAAVVVGAVRFDPDAPDRHVGQRTGWISHIGELMMRTPSISTFSQRYGWMKLG